MKYSIFRIYAALSLGLVLLMAGLSAPLQAGPIFLAGHDPDFHAQSDSNAGNLLSAGINFVVNNSSNPSLPFLWVESAAGDSGSGIPIPPGHRRGELGLNAIGLTRGVDYDWVTGADLPSVDFSLYSAIAVASDYGGMLTQAELDALNARAGDIASFVNAGGGLLALSQGHVDGHTTSGGWFDFLPIDVDSNVLSGVTFQVTPYGASTFGLTDADVSAPTHSYFLDDYGLNVVSTDSNGRITALAGIVNIGGGGFTTVPEPGSLALLGAGLLALGGLRFKKPRKS